MTYTRLSAFYGLSFDQINAMPLAAIRAYTERIAAIQAEQRLIAGDGATLPYLKNPNRVMKDWRKLAYSSITEVRVATPGVLKMIGIGVKYAS